MRTDRILHHFAGSAVATLVALSALLMAVPSWGLWGVLAAALAGLGKEALNGRGTGTIEPSDVFWTLSGAGPVMALWLIWG
ncbi:MAG: hypothetical protein JJU15_07070 [Pararhodobacter sp.]|nr:hypothetical protein [Pararhodobacter sp.]